MENSQRAAYSQALIVRLNRLNEYYIVCSVYYILVVNAGVLLTLCDTAEKIRMEVKGHRVYWQRAVFGSIEPSCSNMTKKSDEKTSIDKLNYEK